MKTYTLKVTDDTGEVKQKSFNCLKMIGLGASIVAVLGNTDIQIVEIVDDKKVVVYHDIIDEEEEF